MSDSALSVIPRLRRFARLMIADAARSDALVKLAIETGREGLRDCDGPQDVARLFFGIVIEAVERDARALGKILIFPDRSRDPPLLPAFWALPYDERLSASLLLVEEMDASLASLVSGVPRSLLEQQAQRALARLQGQLPYSR